MTDEELELMRSYGITVEQKSIYTYMGYKYERFEDAVNYARLDSERRNHTAERNREPSG